MAFLSLNLDFTSNFPSDLGFVSNSFENILAGIESVFKSFANFVRRVATFGQGVEEFWEYYEDEDTGLMILRVEKDSLAVAKTRNALRDLFQ